MTKCKTDFQTNSASKASVRTNHKPHLTSLPPCANDPNTAVKICKKEKRHAVSGRSTTVERPSFNSSSSSSFWRIKCIEVTTRGTEYKQIQVTSSHNIRVISQSGYFNKQWEEILPQQFTSNEEYRITGKNSLRDHSFINRRELLKKLPI